MIIILNSLCEDSQFLGRLDYTSFSQQALMEMLIDGIENPENIGVSKESPEDISEWEGVALNSLSEVTTIRWASRGLRGSVDFQWLPETVEIAIFSQNVLANSIQLNCLPLAINHIFCNHNAFQGEIDLTNLRSTLAFLAVANNQLNGTLNLTKLPPNMTDLYMHNNSFSGTVDLTVLPSVMKVLTLNKNRLNGTIDVTRLPQTMKNMFLSENDFWGVADFTQLPDGLDYFSVAQTQISGEIYKPDRELKKYKVEGSLVKLLPTDLDWTDSEQ